MLDFGFVHNGFFHCHVMISQGTLCLSLMLTDQVSAGFWGDLLREECFFCSCSYQIDWALNTAFPLHPAPNLSPSTSLLSKHLGIWKTTCWGSPSVHCEQWSCCQRPLGLWREGSSKCPLQPSPADVRAGPFGQKPAPFFVVLSPSRHHGFPCSKILWEAGPEGMFC